MNVLVVNLGSTSLKFRLLDMRTQRELAQGRVEELGTAETRVWLSLGGGRSQQSRQAIATHAEALRWCLNALHAGPGGPTVDAVGFKAVHGGPIAGAVRVTPEVLRTMEEFADAAPAHNPPYIAAMRTLAAELPGVPLVAAFETGFHQTIPPERTTYAIPGEWTGEFGIRRYGFHGASHAYVAGRVAELLGRTNLRIVSCHLGGSSSLCAIRGGQSVACSFGLTPQSGLPQSDRVGDFDAFALLPLMRRTGKSAAELLAEMSGRGGLLGISGLSRDMAALLEAARGGNERAELAVRVYVESVRHYLGAFIVALGGLDALVFTGGIGERSPEIRARVCAGLGFLGIELDEDRNAAAVPDVDVAANGAAVRVLAVATNEELIVARQTQAVLTEELGE